MRGITSLLPGFSDGAIFTQDDFAARNLALPATGYQDMTIDQDSATGQLRINIDGIDISLQTSNNLAFTENDQVLVQPGSLGGCRANAGDAA